MVDRVDIAAVVNDTAGLELMDKLSPEALLALQCVALRVGFRIIKRYSKSLQAVKPPKMPPRKPYYRTGRW